MRTKFALIRFSIMCIAVALFNCSKQIAGGDGSETTNGITATVVKSDNSPAVNIMVRLIDSENWYDKSANSISVVIDSVLTDDKGKFRFTSIASHNYNLIISGEVEGAIRKELFVYDDSILSLGTIITQPYAVIRGSVISDTGIATQVLLEGTHFEALVGALGDFSLPAIAAGNFTLFARVESGTATDLTYARNVSLQPGDTAITTGLTAIFGGILLDNFDDRDSLSQLHWITPGSYWYAYTDAGMGGNSTIEPATILSDFKTAFIEAGGYKKTSVHVTFIMGDALTGPHSSIACKLLPDTGDYIDLTDMTKLTFYAKGRDSIRVNFASKAVKKYPPEHSGGDLGVTLVCPVDWEKFTVDIGQIAPPEGSQQALDSLTWEEVRDSVYAIIFGSWAHYGDTVDLYLDEIAVHGVDSEHFSLTK